MKPLSSWNMEFREAQTCVPKLWLLIFSFKVNAYPLLHDYYILKLTKIKLKTHTGD